MNTITVKNLSTFADHAALARVASLMMGDEHRAKHDSFGKEVVKITRRGNVYTVSDRACNQGAD